MAKEKWKKITNSIYSVSSHGRIKNSKNGHIKKLWKHYKGHLKIGIGINGRRKNFFVHRLVAIAFIPNPSNLPLVDHLDEDKANPHMDNLEWVSHSENTQRYYNRKRIKEGVLNGNIL